MRNSKFKSKNAQAPEAIARRSGCFDFLIVNFALARGITPCAPGDSLLRSLTEAEKCAAGLGGSLPLFSPGSASMFLPTAFKLVKLFEMRRNQ